MDCEKERNTPVNIFTDQDAAWLETNDNVRWLKGNKYFTWKANVTDGATCIV